MKQPNLHELINLPYGEANKRLEEAGHYRDADKESRGMKIGEVLEALQTLKGEEGGEQQSTDGEG